MKDRSLNANEADTRLRVVNGLGVVDARHSVVLHRLSKRLVYALSIYQPVPPPFCIDYTLQSGCLYTTAKLSYAVGYPRSSNFSIARRSMSGLHPFLFLIITRAECTLFRFACNVNISNNRGGDI